LLSNEEGTLSAENARAGASAVGQGAKRTGDARAGKAAPREARILSDLLHDLRTPLASLLAAAELLDSGRLGTVPEDVRRLLKVIEGAAEQMSEMVESATARRGAAGEENRE
jgi:signal transduction histidine kinase